MPAQHSQHPFTRLAIINRGEPAQRLLRAATDWALARGTHVTTIALYTEPDRHSAYVRRARVAYDLGPALERGPDGSLQSRYLNMDALERALIETRATAAWVGWGFVAERAEFAELCRKLSIVFIGPTPEAMRKLGDKIESKLLAERASVPVSPWTGGPVGTADAARAWVDVHGLPVMIKATAGGGGRGVRRVDTLETLAPSFSAARDEAQKAFGNGDVYLERVIENARHVEVQIAADVHGTVWPVGLRDCTVQRRHQKVVEEAPPASIPAATQHELAAAAVRLAKEASYTSLGTVEFLFDPKDGRFYFMEMNTRIQVEHPVSEQTTGLDLVGVQLDIAAGERLGPTPPETHGHAIEVRLCAEDPSRDFAPAPGKLTRFRLPAGPHVRVDSGYLEGEEVPSEFDSMIAKIIATGPTREAAILRLRRALDETQIFVQGGASNRAFLAAILASPEFREDRTHTRWLDGAVRTLAPTAPQTLQQLAVCFAAIHVHDSEREEELARLTERARRGRFELGEPKSIEAKVMLGGKSYTAIVSASAKNRYDVRFSGLCFDLAIDAHTVEERVAHVGSVRVSYLIFADARGIVIELEGHTLFAALPQGNRVLAPAPGLVQRVLVEENQTVAQGDLVVVLEAMKTEVYVRAQAAGRVVKRLAAPGMQVKSGATLLDLSDEAATTPANEPTVESSPIACGEPLPLEVLDRLTRGFDAPASDLSRLAHLAVAPPQGVDALIVIIGVMTHVGALLELYVPTVQRLDGPQNELTAAGAMSLLLRGGPGSVKLEQRFLDTLDRLISSMGFDPKAAATWPDAIERVHRSYERIDALAPAIASALGLWHETHAELSLDQRKAYLAALNALIAASPKELAILSNAARRARYLDFERPAEESHRQTNDWAVSELLRSLLRQSEQSWPNHTLDAVASSAEPVLGVVARVAAQDGGRRLLLEIFLRRFYGSVRSIGGIAHGQHQGIAYAETSFDFRDRRRHVVAIVATTADVQQLSRIIASVLDPAHRISECLIDLLLLDGATAEAPELKWIQSVPPPCVRVSVVRLVPDEGRASSYRTFGRQEGEFHEVPLLHDVHPMLAGRFDLWRLRNFDSVRLPSTEDVFVVSATAKDNHEDQRLFSFINLRGSNLARLETMLVEATTAMNAFLDANPDTLAHWNRITVLIADDAFPSLEALSDLFNRLAHQFYLVHLQKLVVLAAGKAHHFAFDGRRFARVRVGDPSRMPIRTLSRYNQRVIRLRRRGFTYAYEIVRLLTPTEPNPLTSIPPGRFEELDLDPATGALVRVRRLPGENTCGIVVGIVANMTQKFPDGMHRIVLLGDASHDMGSLAEPECRRIIAAIDMAERDQLPIEWFAMSAGAAITMKTGTENLDWTARVLRRIIEFSQKGGEINVIVDAINVGAQSYWNAEATMLMHCKGALIMTHEGAMVLTGKKALEFAGAVSAADHQGIGGFERIMGPNGEAQYRAKDLSDAIGLLYRYYDATYVAPGETRVRRRPTVDPVERDLGRAPHEPSDEFATLGDVFSEAKNPGRKRPFSVRSVMRALCDEGSELLERWASMRNAESTVVCDGHIGGHAASIICVEAKSIARSGWVAADGPDTFAPSTLYPQSSKKLARALNAASGRRPVVVLANLSGFDGSPESLRRMQLELGAEIGRAVVNFQGRIIFSVLTRYHGGAYVVFSKALNENIHALALPGSFASVIGGAAAAAVVFRQDVKKRTAMDPRVVAMRSSIGDKPAAAKSAEMAQLLEATEREKMAELATEFDRFHDVNRAVKVRSLDEVVPLAELRAAICRELARST